jgi:hypothetical protein
MMASSPYRERGMMTPRPFSAFVFADIAIHALSRPRRKKTGQIARIGFATND